MTPLVPNLRLRWEEAERSDNENMFSPMPESAGNAMMAIYRHTHRKPHETRQCTNWSAYAGDAVKHVMVAIATSAFP